MAGARIMRLPHFRPFRSIIAGAAALLALLAGPTLHARAGWTPNADDALLLDVRSGQYRLGEGVRGYQGPQGVCVDFADVILALDLPIRLDKRLGRATGWAFSESRAILVDRAMNRLQIGETATDLSEDAIHDAPEGWCVSIPALSQWLGVSLRADTGNALLLIDSKTRLPVELAAERRARAASIRPARSFDLKTLPKADAPFQWWRTPSLDAVVSIGGLNDTRSSGRIDARYELYAAGEIGKASFDARLSSDRNGIPENLRLRAYRTAPEGGLLGPLDATHFAIGDVTSSATALVSQSAIGRGFAVTNRPVDRPETFDRTSFRGELPSGWDAELYRNGQLLGFANDRSDGRYAFLDVPLLYGQNRFEVVLYGPQGQVRRDEKMVSVGLESIPAERTYYWAGINEADADLIGLTRYRDFRTRGWRGSFGLERGIDTRTSIAAYVHSLMIEGDRHSYAEALVRRAIGPAITEISASFETNGASALRAQMLGQIGNSYLSAESIFARGGFRSERIEALVTSQHVVSLDHSIKLGRAFMPVHIDARYKTRADGNNSFESSARVSSNFRGFSLTGQVDYFDDRRRVGPDPASRLEAALLTNARIGRVRLRGETRFRMAPETQFRSATAVAEWAAGPRADWRTELGYDGELDRARIGFGYSKRFKRFALSASAEAASDGSVAAGLNLAFSLGRDPRGTGVRISTTKLASQGQVIAQVYRDRNGDGIRQADEPVEKHVQIAAGRVPVDALTDAGGQVIVDGLTPFQPVLIGVDASSLPDPLVQPAGPGVVVTPRPGIAIAVDLPLRSAGEVEGTLVRAGGGLLEGVDIELIDVEGRVAAVTRSEFDGYFLFEGVPYGRYTLRIGKIAADAAKLSPLLAKIAQVGDRQPSVNLGAVPVDPMILRTAAGE
ncbi:MSCRAMM family protein [Sphingobium boeckii]|uniref:Carboxypeptidase regulatory-like domain-containing protein n=1 Tax=Sphingobium boeckii TaxID=1082345 RepID=A0A7W9AE74_9SPHN|nr:carboxypeptidase-like regulatory domain-containing protein [Sphingobium boeckii]MBB5684067.1 hypothetical protein [Sphingobium boeckii]